LRPPPHDRFAHLASAHRCTCLATNPPYIGSQPHAILLGECVPHVDHALPGCFAPRSVSVMLALLSRGDESLTNFVERRKGEVRCIKARARRRAGAATPRPLRVARPRHSTKHELAGACARWLLLGRTSQNAVRAKFAGSSFHEHRRCRSELHISWGRKRKVRIFEPSRGFDTPLSMPQNNPRFLCRSCHWCFIAPQSRPKVLCSRRTSSRRPRGSNTQDDRATRLLYASRSGRPDLS
jgi:hypothetical protein